MIDGFVVCECGRHGDYIYPGARCVCGRIVKNADEQNRKEHAMYETDRVTIYRAEDGWRWRRRAPNGRIVAESGEAYENLGDAEAGAARQGCEVTVDRGDEDEIGSGA